MKIILNQDISNLGEEGDVKVVADGYARNFLVPKNLAVPFNKANLNMFEQKKVAIEKRKEDKRKDAMGIKARLASETLVIEMPAGEKGRLFGAVTASSIADELSKIGLTVEKKKIEIDGHSLKVTGAATVKIKLYGGETADLKVNVVGIQSEGTESKSSRKEDASADKKIASESESAVEEESAAVEESED